MAPPKAIFRAMNRLHIFLFRRSGGRLGGKVFGSPVLLLTTTGRKTGQARTVPLVYAPDGDCFGVNATENPGWYFNLKSQPQATIEVRGQRLAVRGRDARADEAARIWAAFLRQSPAFQSLGGDEAKTIVVLEPVK